MISSGENFFNESEIHCDCKVCTKAYNEIKPIPYSDNWMKLRDKLNKARHYASIRAGTSTPFHINSWLRCKKHNSTIKGSSPTSSHIKGLAVDIKANSPKQRLFVIQGLCDAGFERIIIYSAFIHTDIDPHKRRGIFR